MGATASGGPAFRGLVEQALLQVPAGRVTTYGDLARALGDVRAARAIGEVLSTNPSPVRVPCHRVVMVDGSLGGYAFGGPEAKARKLRGEGLAVRAGVVQDLDEVAVRAFDLDPLFENLSKRQQQLAKRVSLGRCPAPAVAIGVDASYTAADGAAYAAACAVQIETGDEIASAVAPFDAPIPYVPGYLAFRELPGIVAAVRKLPSVARRRAVLLVDGQGILHPRRCGIASMAGLELDMPAVGAAKGKLVGRVSPRARHFGAFEGRSVSILGEARGFELSRPRGGAALYVSPGTGITQLQSAELVARLTRMDEPSPGPIVLADKMSRDARAAEGAR
jgi:deoxyribonuclease V